MRNWAGADLTLTPHSAAGKAYVRGVKWMGDTNDAVLEPGQSTRIWRNGQELKPLAANQTWRATKRGGNVAFKAVR